jgi:hypothetical protein
MIVLVSCSLLSVPYLLAIIPHGLRRVIVNAPSASSKIPLKTVGE